MFSLYYSVLVGYARVAVAHGIMTAWNNVRASGKSHPEEPDYVAGLMLETVPVLESLWAPIFRASRMSLSISSVFCHQKPFVKSSDFRNKGFVELGDLLVVNVHTDEAGNDHRNALLLQAKKGHHQPHAVKRDEQDQLALYSHWPNFEYVKSPGLNGQSRDVFPKYTHAGAQYALIDDRPPENPGGGLHFHHYSTTFPVGICRPAPILHDFMPLETALCDMVFGRVGREFDDYATAKGQSGWSRVVWDLLESGLKTAFKRKHYAKSSMPRGGGRIGDLAMFFKADWSGRKSSISRQVLGEDAEILYDESPPSFINDNKLESEEPGGVSLVLIESMASEQRNIRRYR